MTRLLQLGPTRASYRELRQALHALAEVEKRCPQHPTFGSERQRLKLATHMGADGGVYVLDEPTNGLHLADVEQLLGLLDQLVIRAGAVQFL